MAIFSQNNPQTQVDFRRYDKEKPNRNVPFNLPNEIAGKIRQLMDRIELNTGSLDIIMGTDGNYYFLEVNPVGQYDFVSKLCNYYLDKRILQFLTSET